MIMLALTQSMILEAGSYQMTYPGKNRLYCYRAACRIPALQRLVLFRSSFDHNCIPFMLPVHNPSDHIAIPQWVSIKARPWIKCKLDLLKTCTILSKADKPVYRIEFVMTTLCVCSRTSIISIQCQCLQIPHG